MPGLLSAGETYLISCSSSNLPIIENICFRTICILNGLYCIMRFSNSTIFPLTKKIPRNTVNLLRPPKLRENSLHFKWIVSWDFRPLVFSLSPGFHHVIQKICLDIHMLNSGRSLTLKKTQHCRWMISKTSRRRTRRGNWQRRVNVGFVSGSVWWYFAVPMAL